MRGARGCCSMWYGLETRSEACSEAHGEARREAIFPSLHHRKEGWLRHQENIAKPPKRRRRGGFPLRPIGKPPRPRYQRMLRDIFLIARPPLLAVMQGGDSRFPTRFHSMQTFCRPSGTLCGKPR